METPKTSDGEAVRSGTQTIERAVQVLRVLAERDRFGWGVVDVAARCGLSRGSAHRILAGLVREGMAYQRSDRRYVLGPLVFDLSLAMADEAAFQQACQAPVARLAKRMGTLAILYLHSGNDSVCLARAGAAPYAGGLDVGARHPLVATAGGVAILMSLPPAERKRVEAAAFAELARLRPAKLDRLQRLLAQSERRGYAFNEGEVTEGVNSFGLPVHGPEGHVFAGLVVSGRAQNFPASRAAEVLAAMREEQAVVEALAVTHGVRTPSRARKVSRI